MSEYKYNVGDLLWVTSDGKCKGDPLYRLVKQMHFPFAVRIHQRFQDMNGVCWYQVLPVEDILKMGISHLNYYENELVDNISYIEKELFEI